MVLGKILIERCIGSAADSMAERDEVIDFVVCESMVGKYLCKPWQWRTRFFRVLRPTEIF